MSADPVTLVREALEAHGCRPRGTEYAFRARCPVHGDGSSNPSSLSVGIGADGRALLNCFAHGCEAEAIVAALGLTIADLFPDGHHRGRRYPERPVRGSDFTGAARTVANVLHALEVLGEDWTLQIGTACPVCGDPGAWLRASRGRVFIDCAEPCSASEFTTVLLGRLKKRKEAA
jgi:hypothetical protein